MRVCGDLPTFAYQTGKANTIDNRFISGRRVATRFDILGLSRVHPAEDESEARG